MPETTNSPINLSFLNLSKFLSQLFTLSDHQTPPPKLEVKKSTEGCVNNGLNQVH